MSTTPNRKDAHLDICLREPVGSARDTGLGAWTVEYDALPELDLADVDLSTTVLGKRLRAPVIVGAMTGGTARARELNTRLARAAARAGVGMALGSQRAMIEDPSLASTYAVRDAAPDLPLLIGNVGAVQLNLGVDAAQLEAALDAVQADALALHLNPLQEAVQLEGNTQFRGLTARIGELAGALSRPVIIKEVGAGISKRTAHKLAALPLAGVEVAGVGGTSWARVESYRGAGLKAAVGRRLAGFGVPTLRSLQACRATLPQAMQVIASGGLRTGHDAAIALALGADAVALARPLLAAAERGEEAAYEALELLIEELRVICFCAGAKRATELVAVRS